MLNQLQPVWKSHEAVKRAIELNRYNAPRQLMDTMDRFKSIGFDHIRHSSYDKFSSRLAELRSQGLAPRIQELVYALVKANVLQTVINKAGEETVKANDKILYDAFYCFGEKLLPN
jgi:hypothetical protein